MQEAYNALILFGVLLIAGMVVRELIPPLQKVLLPASLIGGFIGLILGPQVLGVIDIPDVFASIPGIGMNIIMACVPIGITVSAKKMYQHLDFTFADMSLFGFQLVFGLLLGSFLMRLWPSLPEGWGLMGVAAYFGSHGTIPVVSDAIDPSGAQAALSIGMVMATLGVLFAMIVGMAIANFGVRRGWATFTHDIANQPKYFFRGTLPEDKRESLGKTTVNPTNVTAIALQLGILAIAIKLGELIFTGLAYVIPFFGNIGSMLWSLVGGLVLWPILRKLKLDKFVDRPTINQISNFTLELVILAACATIQLDVISKLFVPLLIHALLSMIFTGIFAFGWMKKINHPQWFEKALMVFGMCCGSNPQGLSLVRAVDPENKSCIYEALGVYNAVFFWNFLLIPFAASVVLYNRVPIYIMGVLLMSTAVIGTIMFSREKKQE